MGLTIIKAMQQIEKGLETKLEKTMFSIFENNVLEYDNLKEVLKGYNNNEFSCENGCISELIYYYQTKEIFKNNFEEILEYLEEFKQNYKVEIRTEYNSMVWLTFEMMVNDWIDKIEYMLENYEPKIYEVEEREVIEFMEVLGLNLEN